MFLWFDLLEVLMLNVLDFSVLRLIMSGLAGWVCFDLGKNIKHEVYVQGKKKNNVLPKNNEKQQKNKKDLRFFF